MKKLTLKGMILAAVFAALTGILTQVQIPLPYIPINLALFAVFLAGALLGPKYGALAMVVYVLLGAVGVPVFSGFSGGLHKLTGPTGGYIVGYIACAFLTGFFSRRWGFGKWNLQLALAMVTGTLACYTLGTAWFMGMTGNSLWVSLGYCVFPFLPGEAVKIALAAALASRLRAPLQASGWKE
jgi:biotin transport system substrate-specific component